MVHAGGRLFLGRDGDARLHLLCRVTDTSIETEQALVEVTGTPQMHDMLEAAMRHL